MKRALNILLLFLFSSSISLLLTSPSHAASPPPPPPFRCNPNDYKILLKIKQSLNNPYVLASWVPNTDCCDWYCIECDSKTNRIVELTILNSVEITTQIPSLVGELPYLRSLTFHKLPNLTGSIPPSVAKLKNLVTLRLSWNNLSGPIPNFLNKLINLKFLDLSFNKFSGSIPPNLSDLKNLIGISLDRNKLTGPIPESFGKFTGSIPAIILSHNELSGSIPSSLGDMDFSDVDLSRNRLVGDASVLFNPNHSLTRSIDLSRNQFEFDLGKVVGFQKSLMSLDLNHNKIFGRIPEGMKDLYFLNVSYNRLCGEIPTGGKLQSLENTSFLHNRCLCGPPLIMTCKKMTFA